MNATKNQIKKTQAPENSVFLKHNWKNKRKKNWNNKSFDNLTTINCYATTIKRET